MKIDLQTSKKVRIEMLPLIDIVFLVLVFFIYAMLSMAVHRGLPVVLPISSTSKIDKIDKKLVLSVTVKADGAIFIDKERVDLEELSVLLKRKASDHKEAGVLIFGDRNLSYQQLFKVLDQIRIAGLQRISLQSEVEQ